MRQFFQFGSTPSSSTSQVPKCAWFCFKLLPSRFQADSSSGLASGALQNCQGGSLQTTGVRKAELVATTMDGEEVLLQHEFNVGKWDFMFGVSWTRVVGRFIRTKAVVISA